MKTKLLVVLVMLFSFSCFAYERVYPPGSSVFKEELDERGYQVTNMYRVQPDGTLKLEEYHNPHISYYLRDQEAKEVVSVRKDDFGDFNWKISMIWTAEINFLDALKTRGWVSLTEFG